MDDQDKTQMTDEELTQMTDEELTEFFLTEFLGIDFEKCFICGEAATFNFDIMAGLCEKHFYPRDLVLELKSIYDQRAEEKSNKKPEHINSNIVPPVKKKQHG